jgi:hypothetical protein
MKEAARAIDEARTDVIAGSAGGAPFPIVSGATIGASGAASSAPS